MSYTLVFSFLGVKPEQAMIYAGTKPALVSTLQLTKVWEVQDKDSLNEEWLVSVPKILYTFCL